MNEKRVSILGAIRRKPRLRQTTLFEKLLKDHRGAAGAAATDVEEQPKIDEVFQADGAGLGAGSSHLRRRRMFDDVIQDDSFDVHLSQASDADLFTLQENTPKKSKGEEEEEEEGTEAGTGGGGGSVSPLSQSISSQLNFDVVCNGGREEEEDSMM